MLRIQSKKIKARWSCFETMSQGNETLEQIQWLYYTYENFFCGSYTCFFPLFDFPWDHLLYYFYPQHPKESHLSWSFWQQNLVQGSEYQLRYLVIGNRKDTVCLQLHGQVSRQPKRCRSPMLDPKGRAFCCVSGSL